MEGDRLILDSNNSCLLCFDKFENCKPRYLYPFHELTSKLNGDLGSVFPDVVSRFGDVSSKRLGQLQLYCDLCERCTDSCKELQKELPGGDVKDHVKMLLDKMNKVKLLREYEKETPAHGLIHFGIVERLRNEIMKMLSRLQMRQKRKIGSSNSERPSKKMRAEGNVSQIVTRSMAAQNEMMKENPFKNDIVISNILSFLKIEEVKTCRFLNKQWNTNSYRFIKQVIDDRWLRLNVKMTKPKRLELLSLLERGSHLPLATKIDVDSNFLEVLEKEGNLLRFFNAVSPKLTKLQITVWRNYVPPCHVISYPEGVTFPHLLTIEFCTIWEHQETCLLYFEVCRRIVQNSPKLVEFKARTCIELVIPPLLDLLKDRQVGSRITVLVLGRYCYLNSSEYVQLAEVGLKLKKTEVRLVDGNAVGVCHFINSQSESLEELGIYFGCAQFELVKMERLRVLKISTHWSRHHASDKDWTLIQRISYKKLFPVLEHLELFILKDRQWLDVFLHLVRSRDDIGDCVRKLTMRDSPSPQAIENAAYLFPNLTKLEIPARLEILQLVYGRMRKLQDLALDYYANYEMKDIRNKGIDNLLMGVQPRRTDCCNNVYFNPDESLLALTELRTLRLRTLGLHDSKVSLIGDEVCRRVLMKMKSLKLLKFCGLDESKGEGINSVGISSSLLDEMRRKMVVLGTKKWYNN